jgi:hypothetical protein
MNAPPGMFLVPPKNPLESDAKGIAQPNDDGATRRIGTKIRIAVYSAILFFVLSNAVTYRFTNEMWSFMMSSQHELFGENGLPTLKGALLHTAVFMFCVSILL